MTVTPTVRSRLEAQGFRGLDDATLGKLAPWLRWSPVLCTVSITIGVVLMSPTVLWSVAAIAFLGTVLPFHPFDLIYNYGIRHLTGTGPLPHQGPQRRFACGFAVVWLIAMGWAFHAGATTVGLVFGVLMIGMAALVSVTHFCAASAIYNALFERRERAGV